MSEHWREPFSKAEMDAMRRASRDPDGVLSDTLALLRRMARFLPFSEDVLAAYHCVRDPKTSARVKFVLIAAFAYFVMPFDAVPDLLPLVGFTDDAAVIAAAIAAVRSAITPAHRAAAQDMLRGDTGF